MNISHVTYNSIFTYCETIGVLVVIYHTVFWGVLEKFFIYGTVADFFALQIHRLTGIRFVADGKVITVRILAAVVTGFWIVVACKITEIFTCAYSWVYKITPDTQLFIFFKIWGGLVFLAVVISALTVTHDELLCLKTNDTDDFFCVDETVHVEIGIFAENGKLGAESHDFSCVLCFQSICFFFDRYTSEDIHLRKPFGDFCSSSAWCRRSLSHRRLPEKVRS